jgi:hypothetical protein
MAMKPAIAFGSNDGQYLSTHSAGFCPTHRLVDRYFHVDNFLRSDELTMTTFHRLSGRAMPILLGSALLMAQPLAAEAQANQDLFDQIQTYSAEGDSMLGQGVGASQFSDVSPNDWAFQALDDLVRRYDCLKGYPNGTFRGDRALSRYEFAAGLNACLQQIERLIAETTADFATREDLETMRRLMEEFEAELAMLGTRVDNLESRVAFLEDNQFSTTTKLNGEILFTLNGLFPNDDTYDTDGDGVTDTAFSDNIVFQDRVRLNFDTSFTGKDRLRTRLQARNVSDWSIDGNVTREARWGFRGDNGNAVEVDTLAYRFPVGSKITAQIFANGVGMDDFLSTLNPFDSSGGGSISRFGQRNPILRTGGQQAGAGFAYKVSDALTFSAGYTADDAADAAQGLFGADYALGAQLQYENDTFGLGLVYINSYTTSSGLNHDTGSLPSNLDGNTPVVANNFGIEALLTPSDAFFVGGWVGFSDAVIIGQAEADVWNYALTLGFPDLGGEGNMLGFVLGQQPRLSGSELPVASLTDGDFGALGLGAREDRDLGYHLEAFYKWQLTEHIDITPGVIWLTNPGHNSTNSDVIAATLRTRFRF